MLSRSLEVVKLTGEDATLGALLHHALEIPLDEIGKIFEQWNNDGPLKNTFLIQIGRSRGPDLEIAGRNSDTPAGSEICQRKKTPEGDRHGEGKGQGGHVLDDVLDKVVQDDDSSEGTGYWTVME